MLLNIDSLAMRGLPTSLVNTEQLTTLLQTLFTTHIRKIPGEIVEMGCFGGGTSVIIQRLLVELRSFKSFHIYDSFEGLPEPTIYDSNRWTNKGDMKVDVGFVEQVFQKAQLPLPIIHKGWFDKLLSTEYPDQIAFAFIDADFYTSTLAALKSIYPKLVSGGACLIHDYGDGTPNQMYFPGVSQACKEFFQDKPEQIALVNSMGYCIKV